MSHAPRLICSIFLSLLVPLSASNDARAAKPNVVLILADDK